MDVRMPDGTIIKNVPEGTTQAELMARYEAAQTANQPKPPPKVRMPYFMGQSFVTPPTPDEVKAAEAIPRQAFGDAVAAPSQLLAGGVDFAMDAARRSGVSMPNVGRLSEPVSRLRNQIAGRDGIEAGPVTGLVQGLVTAPFGAGGFLRSAAQGLGLGAGLATPQESPLEEGAKAAASVAALSGLGKVFGPSAPKSKADARLRDIAAKEGISTTGGTQTGSPMLKELERRAERNVFLGGIGGTNYATRTREAIDDQFARRLWNKVGMEFDEFTQANINMANDEVGKIFAKPFKNGAVTFRSPELVLATKKADRLAKSLAEPDVLTKANALVKKQIEGGSITADNRNVLMNELRGLRTKAYDDVKSKSAGDAIGDLMQSVNNTVVKALPAGKPRDEYMDAMRKWANLKVIEDAFVKSGESARGNLDYTKLKAAIERNMPGGYVRGRADLTELADLGIAMRGGNVLAEGLKFNPIDPSIYLLYNNPFALSARKSNPIDAETTAGLLRAAGIQLGTE